MLVWAWALIWGQWTARAVEAEFKCQDDPRACGNIGNNLEPWVSQWKNSLVGQAPFIIMWRGILCASHSSWQREGERERQTEWEKERERERYSLKAHRTQQHNQSCETEKRKKGSLRTQGATVRAKMCVKSVMSSFPDLQSHKTSQCSWEGAIAYKRMACVGNMHYSAVTPKMNFFVRVQIMINMFSIW